MNARLTFWLSLATAAWMVALRLLNIFKIDMVLVGTIREMFTIPFLLALPICLWFSLSNFRKDGYQIGGTSFWSVVLVMIGLLMLVW